MSEPWLSEVEIRLNELQYYLNDLAQKVDEALQQFPRAWQAGGGGSSSPSYLHWCRVPSGGSGAATGTWPTLTQATFEADVYGNVSGTLTLAAEGATIYWKYLDAADEGKIVPVVKNADGSTWDAVLDSCTAVDLDA
jgi:hypothetical protein